MDYLFARHQPWPVRAALLFCQLREAELDNGWTGKYKIFRGKIYLISLNKCGRFAAGKDIQERTIPERP